MSGVTAGIEAAPSRIQYVEVVDRLSHSHRVIAVVGFIGVTLTAASSFWVGATPSSFDRRGGLLSILSHGGAVAQLLFYSGITLLALAWMLLGRFMMLPQAVRLQTANLQRLAAIWTLPMLAAIPIGSRDAWAYGAQAALANSGINPYKFGPQALGGPFAAEVSPKWFDTPSPYGPFWTLISRAVQASSHDPLAVMYLMRIPAVLGLVLLGYCLPKICAQLGTRADLALWAVILNPLFVISGVGGAHNDLLMSGLISLVILRLITVGRSRSFAAIFLTGVILGLATCIKLPAAVVLPFAGLLAYGAQPGRRNSLDLVSKQQLRLVATCAAGLGAAVVACTVINGFGWGWVGQSGSDSHGGGIRGLVLMVAAVVICWALAARVRPGPIQMLSICLVCLILITPSVLTWYFCWPLAVGAVGICKRNAVIGIAGLSVALVLLIKGNGQIIFVRQETLLAAMVLLAWLVIGPNRRDRDEEGIHVPVSDETQAGT